jgi:uncharacterized protein (TIGR00251 family)
MAELPPWLRLDDLHLSIAVHVQPGARRTAIVGVHGERLKVAVQARASDGRANAALLQLIATALERPPSSVRIVSGASGRNKRVVATRGAFDAAELIRRLLPQ